MSLLRQWLSCKRFNPTPPITATNEACHVGQIYNCWLHSVQWLRRQLLVVTCNGATEYNHIIQSWEPHTSGLNWANTLLHMIGLRFHWGGIYHVWHVETKASLFSLAFYTFYMWTIKATSWSAINIWFEEIKRVFLKLGLNWIAQKTNMYLVDFKSLHFVFHDS